MSIVTASITLSIDGYGAGPRQSIDNPLGEGAERLHRWMFEQPEENRAEIDAITIAGAYIMGRNMFGPVRGEWDRDWRGWWGENPPYHAPVFVLTHHEHEPIEMEGGTTFFFVTDGIDSALEQATRTAGERNVDIAGGVSTINQYLAAGHIDELSIQLAPMTLGGGERLFDGVGDLALEAISARGTELATHLRYRVVR